MRKPHPSVSTRTEEFEPFELPLKQPSEPRRDVILRERRPADRIKDALLRWLEEEM